MDLSSFADSRSFFEFSDRISDPEMSEFQSIKGRAHCFAALIEKIGILPFALLHKFYKTFFRVVGLGFALVLLVLSLGSSGGARELFLRRFSALSKDLADWVLFPFAVLLCLSKLLFGSLIHPALYFRF